ncbi:MYOSIN-BINDING PROTEIN 2 [Salix purpurea]|uniref:MYOSIN-BINDING PROTEIN 2 n=1 Tax=Salix purpurea TaxID=77065 RepID=A0A9Q0SPW4_SALPP|nr:MYOSIN-BINDING PROTEIN 2 [Salix purpurea]KAJ6684975.1 MYOSIN-BINDING PROTEIN 2 [Salix purpurea]
MAATGTSFIKVKRNLQRFTAVLQSAACEWFLLFWLLIDAVLSYLLTKFSSYCGLQIPCMFCSRLDHFLGSDKPGFYKNLICSNHRSEISSLISCHIHGKLADGYGMCEECVLSSAMKSISSPDMNRQLMGKFGFDICALGFQNSLQNRELVSGSVGTRMCSCCNKPRRSRQTSSRIAQLKSPRSGMTKPNIPLPRHLTHRENIRKKREKFPGPVTSHRLVRCDHNPRSHAGYTELTFTSDSENEFPFFDDDEGSIDDKMKELKEESTVPPKTLTGGVSSEKMMAHHSLRSLASDVDLNLQQAGHENYPSALPELISLDDCPSSRVMEAPPGVSAVRSELKFPFFQNYNLSVPSDLMSSLSTVEGSLGAAERNSYFHPGMFLAADYSTGIGDRRNISINKHKEISELTTSIRGGDQVAAEVPSINSCNVDLIDVWTPSANSEEGEEHTFKAEKQTANEHERVDENLELPIKKVFAEVPDLSLNNKINGVEGRGDELKMNGVPDLSLNNKINGVEGRGDELEMNDALGPNGDQTIQTERAESSGLESLDGSFVSEIEGESIVDRLKRQVEHDKQRISALYEELEEERSASAIATNQAMAMINRLQEEKAALHMEALQYLRMMEEQAEHDLEALEKANDLLAEREKQIQDLEAEIDLLQSNTPDEPMAETIDEKSYDLKGKIMSLENTSFREVLNDSEKPATVKSLLSEYDDEKLLISQRLKGLERKLHQFASHGASKFVSNEGESLDYEGSRTNDSTMADNMSMQKDSPVSKGNLPAHETSSALSAKDQDVCTESNHPVFNGQEPSEQHNEIDLVALEKEISGLNGRLEALEFDRNFLEHAFNSLQSEKEGLQFVQEIAHHLEKLRKWG